MPPTIRPREGWPRLGAVRRGPGRVGHKIDATLSHQTFRVYVSDGRDCDGKCSDHSRAGWLCCVKRPVDSRSEQNAMSYRSGEVGERRLDPQGGVGVDSEFVVPAAQDPDEGVDGVQLSSLLARKTRPSRVPGRLHPHHRAGRRGHRAAATGSRRCRGSAGMPVGLRGGCGGCFPCAEALALAHQGDQSGTASSVHGFTAFTVAGLVSPLAGLVGIGNVTPVATVLLTTSATALLSVGLLLRSIPGRERPPAREGARATPERR
jgi:hypothetical protein